MKRNGKIRCLWAVLALMLLLAACGRSETGTAGLEQVFEGVLAPFGEQTGSWSTMDKTRLRSEFGITESMAEEVMAMEGEGETDLFIGIRSKTGKGAEVQQALENSADRLAQKEYARQLDQAKAACITVRRYGDTVFLVSAGRAGEEEMQNGSLQDLAVQWHRQRVTALDEMLGTTGTGRDDDTLNTPAGEAHGNYGGTGETQSDR